MYVPEDPHRLLKAFSIREVRRMWAGPNIALGASIMKLDGKVAVITGGTVISTEIAKQFVLGERHLRPTLQSPFF